MSTGKRALLLLFVLLLPFVSTRIRASDEIEYFVYLPSLAFDHDLEFGNEYDYFYRKSPKTLDLFKGTFLDKREPDTGRHINFGPIGSALLWSPFYASAHLGVLVARALGFHVAADGLSAPYVASCCYASALYALLGFLLIHSMLRRFGSFPEWIAAGSAAALWLATPCLYYMTIAPGFSHAASLFAVSLCLWLFLFARERKGEHLGDFALIGAAGGLMGLVREQDALFLAAPALWIVVEAFRSRRPAWGVLRLLLLGATAAAVFFPQLLVYRALNGHFRPSHMVSEKLTYWSPHSLQVLFDPGHGLFVWTPLLLLAFAGLLYQSLAKRDGVSGLLLVCFLLQVWINGALLTWTQGGAFGSRRFVATTAVFAWGLAAVLKTSSRRLARPVVAAILLLFVWWNVSLIVQFGLKLMDRQGLEWPKVARNQFVEVPPRLTRVLYLFFTDRERLAREGVGGSP